MTKYLIDTNALLAQPELLREYDIVIPSHILREIEHLELVRKSERGLQAQIRRAKRFMEDSEHTYVDLKDYKFNLREDWDGDYTDNILIQIVVDNGYGMITNDRLLKEKCKLYNVELLDFNDNSAFEDNRGFKEVYMVDSELKEIYENLNENTFKLMVNEYLVVYDDFAEDLEILDIFKWDGEYMIALPKNKNGEMHLNFTSTAFSNFVPKDAQQMMAVDSIFNNQITQLRGKAGSGKSKIALETAWHLIERNNGGNVGYDKLVIFVNPTPTRDSQELGFYTGDRFEKLMQSSVGTMLISKFGDKEGVLLEVMANRLEILPMVDIRGYETGDKNIIVWFLEAQNLTSDLMKLGLQRISENTKVIIDGDYHQQVDREVYANDNGMRRTSEIFRGQDLYGEIELQNVYRSRIAELADLM